MPAKANMIGPKGQFYADPEPSPDEVTFKQDNTSAAYYTSPYYLAHKSQVQTIPPRHNNVPLDLSDFLSPEILTAIKQAGRIVFHAVGDTGYDRPIFAIPGNHDAMVFGKTSTAPTNVSLAAFQTNFCASAPGRSPDALGLMRSVMTQPGVYFTVDAPFASVIGLYSNALEGPGVISSQGGHYPISDDQLAFLEAELARLKPQRQANQRSVVLAVHHPPLSIDAVHGGSTGLQQDLVTCFAAAGLWPDLVLSGHAHLYQRFTHRTASGQEIPYIVAGSGGFAATPPIAKQPPPGTTIGDDTLAIAPIVEFGFLTISTDAKTLTVAFQTSTSAGVQLRDSVSVDLVHGRIASAKKSATKSESTTVKKSRPTKNTPSR
jgi:hypothetical protein